MSVLLGAKTVEREKGATRRGTVCSRGKKEGKDPWLGRRSPGTRSAEGSQETHG